MKRTNDIFSQIEQDPGFRDDDRAVEEIVVIGVGGGGVNAASRMYSRHVKGTKYVIVNTDKYSLMQSPVPSKVVIGDGHGAGDKPEKAQKAADAAADAIGEVLPEQVRMVFVTAAMGGGTGTGAAPVVARVVHEKGLLTIGVVTIPFLFEGKLKIKKALKGAQEMSKYVDAMIVINNQKLVECYPENTMIDNFALADETLVRSVTSISDLIEMIGFWNIDFNDVDTTLRNGSVAIISSGIGIGKSRVDDAINDALHSPLLKNRDVFGSSRLLMAVYTSSAKEHTLVTDEIKTIENFKKKFRNEPHQITGWYYDDSLGEQVKIIILAAGFDYSFDDEITSPHLRVMSPMQMDDDNFIRQFEDQPTLKQQQTEQEESQNSRKLILF
ncbi:MAG: cell division FtsZ family protein [Muribaculaceae bacterium]|nr:cell division FtsZ family protein [Muribaculaceae bacterium]